MHKLIYENLNAADVAVDFATSEMLLSISTVSKSFSFYVINELTLLFSFQNSRSAPKVMADFD